MLQRLAQTSGWKLSAWKLSAAPNHVPKGREGARHRSPREAS